MSLSCCPNPHSNCYASFTVSDSERGLGPIVASLSLGSAAVLYFRVYADVRQEGKGTGNALTLTLRHVSCSSDPCSAVDANSTSGRCFVLVMEGAAVQEYYE
jgi:hypothetical protein